MTKRLQHVFQISELTQKISHHSIITLQIGVLVLLLNGCSGSEHEDLNAYIERVKTEHRGRVKPLPEIKPYETFTYAAHDLRDPFTTFQVLAAATEDDNSVSGPIKDRKKQPLEQFPLDTLKFVGHLEKNGVRWGLIEAPDATVYRIQVGNYLGKNFGQILSISDSNVKIKEKITNSNSGWLDRDASLTISE